MRPLGVTTLEDKIVQRATVEVMNAIYETDFLGFSYGFRPGKGQHNALDALYVGILTKKVNWVLDGDISSFFDGLDQEWLVKFIEHRIADQRVVRLIRKWLRAGVLEEGRWTCSEEGTPQGGSASPLMANIFLHYVFDLWVHQWRKTKARGDVIVVRWADDFVVGVQHRSDAERFHKDLVERFAKFKLRLHPEKTRLIEFGYFAANNRRRRGQGKPETFNFLGFTHICGKKRSNGMFTVYRRTISKRDRAKLKEIKTGLRRRMHQPVPEVGKWLKTVVEGHNRYYGVPSNEQSLSSFRFHVTRLVDYKRMQWKSRAHFFAVAAQAMRRILVEHARKRHFAKRGGGAVQVSLDEAATVSEKQAADLIALDDALTSLEAIDPRKSRIVELRYIGGLNIEETAEVLDISPATVQREWRSAKAWLYRTISEGASDER